MSKKNKNKINENSVTGKNESMFNRHYLLISVLLLLATTFIVYSNTFKNSFQYDDVHHIMQNRQIKDLGSFTDPAYWFDFINRAPAQFTFAINYHLGRYKVEGYHTVNLFIHISSSIFVFILLGLLLDSVSIKNNYIINNKKPIRLFSALIFALHPIQTESVTYIVQRMESLSVAFYLSALIFYYIARKKTFKDIKQYLNFILFLFFGLLAVLTKQASFSLPLAVLLLEIYFIRDENGRPNKTIIIGLTSVLSLALIIGLILNILPIEYLANTTRTEYMMTQFTVIPKYLFLMFFPAGQNIDHHILFPFGFLDPKVLFGIIFIAIIFWFSYFLHKKGHIILSFSISWFFAMIALRSSVLPISDLMSEHRLYAAMMGYGLFVVAGLYYLKDRIDFFRSGNIASIGLVVLIAIYSFTTYQRNKVWKNELSLWKDSVSKSPDKFRPNYNVAEALKKSGDSKLALEYYLKSYKLNSRSFGVCNNIGNIYSENKDYDKAEKYYVNALKLNPEYPKALNNLANVYFKKGKYNEAEKLYIHASKNDRDFIDPVLNLGHLYFISENYNLAINKYKRVLELSPNHEQARNNLKILENKLGVMK